MYLYSAEQVPGSTTTPASTQRLHHTLETKKLIAPKPTFKYTPTYTYPQFPAQSKGSVIAITFSMFFPTEV